MTSVPTNPALPPSAPPVAPTAGAPAQGLGPSDPARATGAQDGADGGDPSVRAIMASASYPGDQDPPGRPTDYL
jgi:hypothetical protein